jgi:hypothetical protein
VVSNKAALIKVALKKAALSKAALSKAALNQAFPNTGPNPNLPVCNKPVPHTLIFMMPIILCRTPPYRAVPVQLKMGVPGMAVLGPPKAPRTPEAAVANTATSPEVKAVPSSQQTWASLLTVSFPALIK